MKKFLSCLIIIIILLCFFPIKAQADGAYPFNVTYQFYSDWNSTDLIIETTLETQYLAEGDVFFTSSLAKEIGYEYEGYECREWFCGSIEVIGGGGTLPPVDYEIDYSDYSISGTMVAGPVDIIYTYVPFNDYFYVEHYLETEYGSNEFELFETKRYAGYVYGFSGHEYSPIFLEYDGYTAVESDESAPIQLRQVGETPVTFHCYYTLIEAPASTETPAPTEPTETPEPTVSPEPIETSEPTVSPEPTNIPMPTPTPQKEYIPFPYPEKEIEVVYITPQPQPEKERTIFYSDPLTISIPPINTNNSGEEIIDTPTPLAVFEEPGHWALVNFILMLCSVCCLIRTDEKKKTNVFTIGFAIASVILFVFTEFTNLNMVFTDKYTWIMGILCVGALISSFVYKRKQVKEEEQKEI